MRGKLAILLFIQFLIITCGTEKNKPLNSELTDNETIIQIKEEQIVGELLPIEACIHAIIPLETNSMSAIGNCFKLAFTSDRIIILDAMNISDMSSNPKVLMFDTLGNFKQLVGGRGKGPQEYIAPMNIQIGQKGEIQVYCNFKSSVLTYDNSGIFLSATKLPFRTPYFAALDSTSLIFENPKPKQNECQIGIYNHIKDSILCCLPFSYQEKENIFITNFNAELGFTKFNNSIFFCPQTSTKIFELVNGVAVTKYNLDIAGLSFHFLKPPKKTTPEKTIQELQKLRNKKSEGADQLEKISYLQTNDYDKINFSFNWHPRLYTILRKKDSGRIMVGTTQSTTRNNLKEISNLLLFYAKSTYNGQFVAAINTEDLKNLSDIFGLLPLETREKLCNYEKIKKIADSRNNTSNMVLVVFSLHSTATL